MDPHQRVDALQMLGAGGRIFAVEIRMRGSIDGFLAIDYLAEIGRQFLVGGVTACPERVAADCGNGVVVQMRHPRGLLLVHKVRVPASRAAWVAEVGFDFSGLEGRPYD